MRAHVAVFDDWDAVQFLTSAQRCFTEHRFIHQVQKMRQVFASIVSTECNSGVAVVVCLFQRQRYGEGAIPVRNVHHCESGMALRSIVRPSHLKI